ncbi:MAG: hypothetical protein QNJ09_00625 [Paracoccaceae bacterium]|nr:hypothetical protein [Paracoccaceae bacterium]
MKSALESAIAVLSLFASLATVSGALNTILPFVAEHILIVLGVSAAVSIVILWPRRTETASIGFNVTPRESRHTPMRYRWVALSALAHIAIIGFAVWELTRRVDGERVFPNPSASIFHMLSPFAAAHAQSTSPSNSGLEIVSFGLAEARTTFIEDPEEVDFGFSPGPRLRTFRMPHSWFQRADQDLCMSEIHEAASTPAISALIIGRGLKAYARLTDRAALLPYIQNNSARITLDFHTRRPDKTAELLPRRSDWLVLNESGQEGRDAASALLLWLKHCVAIPYPVFEVVLRNTTDSDIIITDIEYDVEDIGGYKGYIDDPAQYIETYHFDLAYVKGVQRHRLMPSFVVAPRSADSFRLRLFSSHDDAGLSWRLKLRLNSSNGSVETDTFQILMSGKPTWGTSRFK